MGSASSKGARCDLDKWVGSVLDLTNVCVPEEVPNKQDVDSTTSKLSNNEFEGTLSVCNLSPVSNAARSSKSSLPKSALHDSKTLLSILSMGNDGVRMKPSVALKGSSTWSSEDDALLETAVGSVAKKKNIDPPCWRELQYGFNGGKFTDDFALEFWLYVAQLMKPKDATACYLRYYEIHGSPVARFSVTSKTPSEESVSTCALKKTHSGNGIRNSEPKGIS